MSTNNQNQNRQQNVFFSIIEQFNEAEQAMDAMQKSQGAMEDAYAERMESIEAHIDTFKAAYEALSQSVIDNDLSKNVIDFGTQLLNIITGIVDALGGVKTFAPLITGTLATFVSAFSKSGLFSKVLSGSGISAIISSVKSLGSAIAGIGKTGFSLSSLLGIFSTPAGIGVVVAGLTTAAVLISKIYKLVQENSYEGRVKHAQELAEQYEQDFGEGSRYDELTNKTRVLTDAERDELEVLKAIRREREAEVHGAETSAYKKWRKDQDKDIEVIEGEYIGDTLFPAEPRTLKRSAKQLEDYTTALEQLDDEYNNHQKSVDEYRHGLDELITGSESYYNTLIKYRDLVANDDSLEKLSEDETAFIEWRENLMKRSEQFSEKVFDDPVAKARRNLEDYVAAMKSKYDGGDDISFINFVRSQPEYIKLSNELQEAMAETAETAEEMSGKVQTASEKARESLSKLWNEEDFASTKESLIELANTAGGITADAVEELAAKNERLKTVMDETGMSARLMAGYLTREALTGDGESLLTEQILGVDAALKMVEDRCVSATEALKRFNEATAVDNADVAKSYAQAYKQFLDDWESGRTGSNTVRAAANLFFSPQQLAEMKWDLQAIGEQLSSDFFQAIFSTDGDPGANFATYIRSHYTEALKEAVEITENVDGTFDIAVSSAQKLADALHVDVGVANAFIEAMGAWGVHLFKTGEELEVLAENLGILGDSASNLEKVESAIQQLAEQHLTGDQIKAELEALAEGGYINIDSSAIDELDTKIAQAINDTDQLDGKAPTYNITSNVKEEISDVKALDDMTISNKYYEIEEHHKVTGDTLSANASGTRNAIGGPTLVNELGPELISENGHAYIANGGRPAIVNLQHGAVVLNAKETRSVLGGSKLSGAIGAMAYGSHATFPSNYSAGGYSGGGGGGSSSSKSSSSSSNSSSSSDKVETWFERMYKDHKHLLEMDQENVEDFLDWLNDAYKKAYAEGIIELDDYYKYAEEVYSGLQDLFKDHLSDVEHAIDLAERAGDGNTDILNMYQTLLNEINAELESAFARGLDENDEYVQYLQNQWYTYYDKLKDARDDAQDDAMDAVDDLVKYRIKMLKQYIKNEIDSLKERLSYLKDFYQKQKDMLKDVADTEDYYDEQNDKRKKVSDIEAQLAMLDLDNSAWAQKRKAKLQEELADAQKDLRKFERDHAIEVAQEELDAAYEIQERAINARIDQLEDLSDNPKALYEQALKDVQNNSVELYEEMIEFNNKYGDGIQKTIVDMWESAYVSLKNYADLYHEFYNGINLVNATGYYPDTSGVGGNYLVRNPGGSGVKTGTVDVPEVTSAATSYVDVDDQTAAMLAQAQAALQAQIDSVLNNVSALQNQALQALQNSAAAALGGIMNQSNYGGINMGDIIINGSATADTISEIRRAQRENVDNMLKEFNKLYSR